VFRFEGGEFVRLVREVPYTDVRVGDCGVVWGVYELQPPLYEACFVMQCGELSDLMFTEDDVELLRDLNQAPCAERLREILGALEEANERLKNARTLDSGCRTDKD
jgi:hypothetical protein